jgi:hypothetical protein
MIRPWALLALLATSAYAQEAKEAPKTDSEKAEPYIAKGMPAPDRPWMSKDYSAAARLLGEIKADGGLALPRLRDDPSGGVFARMVDPANLRMIDDEKVPFEQRFADAMGTLSAINSTLTVYLVAKDERQPFGAEFIELVLFEMRVIERVTALTDIFVAKLSDAQRAEPARQEGLAQMRSGFAQVVVGAFTMLGETKQYSPEELRGFAARLPDRLAGIWSFLPPATQSEFRLKAGDLARSHADAEIRKSMERLVKALDSRPAKKPEPEGR